MNPNGMAGQGGLANESYRFDDIVVDAAAHTLSRAGTPQTVEPKAFAVLLKLLRRAGELVGRDELLDEVWGHRHVTPGVLTRVIAQLRHALGDDSQRPRYIQTQHALGYRFIGQLREAEADEPSAEPASDAPEGVAAFRQSVPPALNIAANEAEPAGAEYEEDLDVLRPEADERLIDEQHVDQQRAAEPEVAPFATRRRVLTARRWWLAAAALLVIAAGGYWFGQRMTSVAPVSEASIAVLPFASLSADSRDSYFAEGLGVEMHDALAGVPGLRVVAAPRGGARQQVDIKALGARLGVATLLDASVRREGPRVRISARLSDTRTGFTLWAHSYDRETGDVFALQSDIANEVVRALVGVLPGAGLDTARQVLARRLTPTRNVAAYDAYLKGQQEMRGGGDRAADIAINFYRGALAIDPGFARAQAGICRAEIARFEATRDAAAFERGKSACQRAASMDPSLREVSLALGDMHRVHGESDKAVEQYTHALEDPALRFDAYVGLGRVASALGRGGVALDYFERARKLRPGDPLVFRERGYHQYTSGDVPAAIESFRVAAALQPEDYSVWSSLGGLYQTNGDMAQANAAFERSLAIKPNYGALSNLGTLKYDSGAYAQAADLYRHATEIDGNDFRLWGNLGDALSASPATAAQARESYQKAANMAEPYLRIKPDDAQGFAQLGWYRANLGEDGEARKMLAKAEALATERGEVAYWGAQTMAQIGDGAAARKQMELARAAGIPEQRLQTPPVLRKLLGTATAVVPPEKDRQ